MASAKKCDRCGRFFDHQKEDIKYVAFTNITDNLVFTVVKNVQATHDKHVYK